LRAIIRITSKLSRKKHISGSSWNGNCSSNASIAPALVCSEKSNSVKIKLTSNLLEITAQSPDFGEAHESMAISYSGPDLQVAFNPAFVMDPLRALTKDEVFFELKDEVSPGVFKTLENFICVIMPVRLS